MANGAWELSPTPPQDYAGIRCNLRFIFSPISCLLRVESVLTEKSCQKSAEG